MEVFVLAVVNGGDNFLILYYISYCISKGKVNSDFYHVEIRSNPEQGCFL